jgi:phage tail sheath protein FI
MAQFKTPGVYIVEKNAFPNSVVEVATAVPAFVGHTQIADYKGESLTGKPWRISSMAEFEAAFGKAARPAFAFAPALGLDVDFTTARGAPVAGTAEEYTAAMAAAETAAKEKLDAAADEDKPALQQAYAAAQASNKDAPAIAAVLTARAKAEIAQKTLSENGAGEKDVNRKAYAAALAELRSAEGKRPAIAYRLQRTNDDYLLHRSMQLFFQNGGGACYIVSTGNYGMAFERARFEAGVDALRKEQEPTMLVIPEAVRLEAKDCYGLQQQMLNHCGYVMKSRFAILDVHEGNKDLNDKPVERFRENIGTSFLAFGAAYYPWVNTSIVPLKDLDFSHLDTASRASLKDLLGREMADVLHADTTGDPAAELKAKQVGDTLDQIVNATTPDDIDIAHKTLNTISPLYGRILLAMQRQLNLMPPSAAMAGLYTMVDNTRGVWKAPANVSLASVTGPAVNLTHAEQEDLNVTTNGKSVNAIRSFIGEGTLVWGARTLDGNSLDWRYINVRRTMIMLEESLRLACKAYVFEPNVANTWVTIKSMARNFLTSIWKRGGLAGASPDDAFSVQVGLNETMTADDILEGILRVTVLVAISRPAEFIEITFQQQMQKS